MARPNHDEFSATQTGDLSSRVNQFLEMGSQ